MELKPVNGMKNRDSIINEILNKYKNTSVEINIFKHSQPPLRQEIIQVARTLFYLFIFLVYELKFVNQALQNIPLFLYVIRTQVIKMSACNFCRNWCLCLT